MVVVTAFGIGLKRLPMHGFWKFGHFVAPFDAFRGTAMADLGVYKCFNTNTSDVTLADDKTFAT